MKNYHIILRLSEHSEHEGFFLTEKKKKTQNQ